MIKAKKVQVGTDDIFLTTRKDDKVSQVYVSAREGFTLVEMRDEVIVQRKKRKGVVEEVEESEIVSAHAFCGKPIEVTIDLDNEEDAENWQTQFFGEDDFDDEMIDE